MASCFRNILILCLFVASPSFGQLANNDDLQSWNDVNFTVKIREKVDLFFPTTLRFGKNAGGFNEGWAGAGVVLKPTRKLSITPYYTFIKVRGPAGVLRTEHRYHLRGVYRFPTKRFGLSHRSQLEYRDLPIRNTWRYRPSMTIEKALPDSFIKKSRVYATEEPFYDSASGRFSRNRFSVGVGKSFSKNLALDVYYLRQDDTFAGPAVVHVIGTTWKVSL